MEQSFRQALTISNGDFHIFYQSTVSLVLIALTIISIVFPIVKDWGKKRKASTTENQIIGMK
ncbi:hypothetical protein [Tepidibacillus decaturensis]|uniref:Uncharacterized protein n=1 Tax=Tepidibacillus decaturensis TaxID=1413211 RepID=A0A135L794_9BACI|nr:hypothetical protein [Tepidibacillus decaturensis]KXG44693.1 hypothetical protein U473_12165 [Tepidibacillus decaturensis]